MIEKRAIKELNGLPRDVRGRILTKIRTIVIIDPYPSGTGDIKQIGATDFLRLRVGNYRVFYEIDLESKTVFILSVKHRSKAYREI